MQEKIYNIKVSFVVTHMQQQSEALHTLFFYFILFVFKASSPAIGM